MHKRVESELGTSTDKLRPSESETTLTSEWAEFMDAVSISGARFVAKGDELPARRLIWTVLILLGFGLMSYQLIERISYFYSYPSNTLLVTHYPDKLPLPTITLCSESRYVSYKAPPDIQILLQAMFPPLGGCCSSLVANFSVLDGFTPPNNDWINQYAAMSRDMIADSGISYCLTPAGGDCRSSRYWRPVWTEMGLCAQFNEDGQEVIKSPGEEGGLRFQTLALVQYYLAPLANFDGFRIALTSPGEYPDILNYGIHIGTGKEVSISIEKTEINLLPPPYGGCSENPSSNFSSVYTVSSCTRSCKASAAAAACGCNHEAYYNVSSQYKTCSPSEFYHCYRPVFANTSVDTCSECRAPCHETRYSYSISQGEFSNTSLDAFAAIIPSWDRRMVKDNFSFLSLYYPSLSYTEITQERAYDIFTLFCDMGGALGLLLGSTFLTVYEFFDFFIFFLVKKYIIKQQ